MRANRNNVQDWEKFTVVPQAGGKVAFRCSNGKFVSSENGNGGMNCNRNQAQGWEKFTLESLGGNVFAIKGNNGKYVSSENGANSGITCNRSQPQSWERFIFSGLAQAKSSIRQAPNVQELTASISTQLSTIYPNPVKAGDLINIHTSLSEVKSITLLNSSGQNISEVSKSNILSENQSITIALSTIPDLKSGLYLARIRTGNGQENIRLLVR